MKKVVIEGPGSYDKLLIKEFSTPEIGPDELLIECKACGVNFADCCVRMGVYGSAKKYVGWPITPGFEIAGIVQEVGSGVSTYKKGDRVIGITRFGGYTSHLVVSEQQLFRLPDGFSFEEGAAFPVIFLTAAYALFELAHPRPGNSVLVHSAAGGVGSALVQLAKLSGYHVAGVVGAPHKIEAVKSLGADVVIDKSSENLWQTAKRFAPEGYHVILDANGQETLKESYRHLGPGGKLVVYGFHTMLSKGRGTPNWLKVVWQYLTATQFDPMRMTTDNRSVMAFNLSYLFSQKELLDEIMSKPLKWLQEGKLHLPKITSFPLEKVGDAHRALESGQTIGKLILIP